MSRWPRGGYKGSAPASIPQRPEGPGANVNFDPCETLRVKVTGYEKALREIDLYTLPRGSSTELEVYMKIAADVKSIARKALSAGEVR